MSFVCRKLCTVIFWETKRHRILYLYSVQTQALTKNYALRKKHIVEI